jgi:DNA polymerase-3 subunit beta
MNFTTDQRKLASAVSWAARRVPSRPESPILAGILIDLDDARAYFTGFDHEVMATAVLEPDGPWTPGKCVVSGRLLAELVKSLPPKPVRIAFDDHDETYLTLTCGPVKATLPLMPAEDYPSLPTAPEPIGTVHAEDFAKQVARVAPACDFTMERALPALTGIHLAFGDDRLTVAATDRFRLATNTVPGWRPNPDVAEQVDFPILVPGAVLVDVLKVCDFDGPLEIGVTGGTVSFDTGQRTIVSSLLDANDFPSHGGRIRSRAVTPTVIEVEPMTDALKRAVMVLDAKEPVWLAFDNGHVLLTAGSGRGQVTAELECDHPGKPLEIAVNPHYFADAIAHTGEFAELTIADPRKPVLVTAPKDEAFVHVVMPIRAN